MVKTKVFLEAEKRWELGAVGGGGKGRIIWGNYLWSGKKKMNSSDDRIFCEKTEIASGNTLLTQDYLHRCLP